jgi:hypothetical protein
MSIEQRIAVTVFRLQLFFIVLREYANVVHGTASIGADANFANELNAAGDGMSTNRYLKPMPMGTPPTTCFRTSSQEKSERTTSR